MKNPEPRPPSDLTASQDKGLSIFFDNRPARRRALFEVKRRIWKELTDRLKRSEGACQ